MYAENIRLVFYELHLEIICVMHSMVYFFCFFFYIYTNIVIYFVCLTVLFYEFLVDESHFVSQGGYMLWK